MATLAPEAPKFTHWNQPLPKDALAGGHLRAGLSVIVDVDTRTAPDGRALAAK